MPKITIETEHGFEFYIAYTTVDGVHRDVVLQGPGLGWRVSCYTDEKLFQAVGSCRISFPEALKRTLVYLDQYLKGSA